MNCKKCGALLEENNKICKNCGTNNEDKPNFRYQKSEPKQVVIMPNDKKTTMWMAVGIMVLAAIGIAYAVFNRCEACPTCEDLTPTNLATTSYKIKLSGYDVILKDSYKYAVEGNTLYVSDAKDNWGLSLYVVEGTYKSLLERQEKLEENMTLDGYTIKEMTEKTINNHQFLIIEAERTSTKALFALTAVTDAEVGVIVAQIYNITNIYDYSTLEEMAPTINALKFNNPPLSVTIKDYDLSRFSLFTK